MIKIPFEDGTKISNAKVTIDETDYIVTPAQYSGTTPLTAANLNLMQDNIEDAIDSVVPYTSSSLTILDDYFSSSTIDINSVQKYGKIVQVQFRGLLQKNVPNNTAFLNSPYGAVLGAAQAQVLYTGGQYSVSDTVWFYLTASGDIKGPALTANTWVHISFVYFTNQLN